MNAATLASSSFDSDGGTERLSSARLSVSGALDMQEEEDDEAANAEQGERNDCGCLPWHLRYFLPHHFFTHQVSQLADLV